MRRVDYLSWESNQGIFGLGKVMTAQSESSYPNPVRTQRSSRWTREELIAAKPLTHEITAQFSPELRNSLGWPALALHRASTPPRITAVKNPYAIRMRFSPNLQRY